MKKNIEHIYIHYPFCTSRCGYCSFYTENYSQKKQLSYLDLLRKEIDILEQDFSFRAKSIYFGGGSPSLMSGTMLKEILAEFPERKASCEISLECNPITLTNSYLDNLIYSGVNRISLGIQTMNDVFLKYLGRKHRPEQVVNLIPKLRQKGFYNISGDLIYGIPGQNIRDLEEDISKFIDLGLDHISIYCLSLDSDSILYSDKACLPEDDLVADMYNLICFKLEKANFKQYEISNFSKLGHESQHNLAYWQQKDYIGLGAGAYGTINKMRYNNNSFYAWETDLQKKVIFPNQENLSDLDKMNEFIMLQLRLNTGISVSELMNKYNYDILSKKMETLTKFQDYDLLLVKENKISLTDKGKFISSYIISELMNE